MSIQEKWLNFKQVLLGGDWLLSFLIVGVAGSSFWLGQQSVLAPVKSVSSEITSLQSAAGAPPTGEGIEVANKPLLPPELVPTPDVPTAAAQKSLSQPPATPPPAQPAAAIAAGGAYVASKSGTKYHLPWCAGAKAIKAENKIWFDTKAEAEAAGYTAAANCKGI